MGLYLFLSQNEDDKSEAKDYLLSLGFRPISERHTSSYVHKDLGIIGIGTESGRIQINFKDGPFADQYQQIIDRMREIYLIDRYQFDYGTSYDALSLEGLILRE